MSVPFRILAVSDLHGDLDPARRALAAANPDLLVCCGDWGDPGEVTLADLEWFTARGPVLTVFGNHDPLEALVQWRNSDGTPVVLLHGEVRAVGPARIAGISGIWAKSHAKPYYITDEEVAAVAERTAAQGPVDLLLTHGAPLGVADLTVEGRHGGHRCFLDAFRRIGPRVYLAGHLHRCQEHRTRDGRVLRNVGRTPRGEATLMSVVGDEWTVEPFAWDQAGGCGEGRQP
jgi:Icc-related predicted phosphoesterase